MIALFSPFGALCVVPLTFPSFPDLMHMETSARTGENVEESFLKCARAILTKIESGGSWAGEKSHIWYGKFSLSLSVFSFIHSFLFFIISLLSTHTLHPYQSLSLSHFLLSSFPFLLAFYA